MARGYCTECGWIINLGKKPRKGQSVSCYRCGAGMVVAKLSPIELELIAIQETMDWDDENFYLDFDLGPTKHWPIV